MAVPIGHKLHQKNFFLGSSPINIEHFDDVYNYIVQPNLDFNFLIFVQLESRFRT